MRPVKLTLVQERSPADFTFRLALNVNFLKAEPGIPQQVEFSLFPTVPIHDAKVRVKLGTQVLKDLGPVSFAPMTPVKVGVPVEAVAAFRKALEYPQNLGVGKPDKPHDEETLFWLGEALQAAGSADAAHGAWTQAAAEGKDGPTLSRLYRGLALRRLGQPEEADKILIPLAQIKAGETPGAAELYASGLLSLFDNRSDLAVGKFTAALAADPGF
jgi:tetratricopeptide (TPR) repeat protein